MNGCHNRKPLREVAFVQTGWITLQSSRLPVMKWIKDPMTKKCQYQILKKDDPKCVGCNELEEAR